MVPTCYNPSSSSKSGLSGQDKTSGGVSDESGPTRRDDHGGSDLCSRDETADAFLEIFYQCAAQTNGGYITCNCGAAQTTKDVYGPESHTADVKPSGHAISPAPEARMAGVAAAPVGPHHISLSDVHQSFNGTSTLSATQHSGNEYAARQRHDNSYRRVMRVYANRHENRQTYETTDSNSLRRLLLTGERFLYFLDDDVFYYPNQMPFTRILEHTNVGKKRYLGPTMGKRAPEPSPSNCVRRSRRRTRYSRSGGRTNRSYSW